MTRPGSQAGVVYVEFLLAFIPFFVLCLGCVQLALIVTAHVVVKHAAVMATRAAVLVVDDDPYFDDTAGTRRRHLSSTVKGSNVATALPGLGTLPRLPASVPENERGGCDRLTRVRRAAYVPLSVLAPAHLEASLGGAATLEHALGHHPLLRVAYGLGFYNRVASAITFPTHPGGDELRQLNGASEAFRADDVITTRVSYLFACRVPIARELLCDSVPGLEDDEALSEFAHAEWHDPRLFRWLGSLERFAKVRAEASLPHQAAPYDYASELCKTRQKLAGCEGAGP